MAADLGDAVAFASGGTVPEALAEAPGVADPSGVIDAVGAGEADALGPAAGGGGLFSELVLVATPAVVLEVVLLLEKVAPADTPKCE